MKPTRYLLRSFLIGLLISSASFADSMTCGVRLVVTGDFKYDVQETCGDPDHKEHFVIDGPVQSRDRHGRRYSLDGLRVDTWVYRYGPQRFNRVLRFENGRLVKIEKTRR